MSVATIGNISIDTHSMTVFKDGVDAKLTRREYDIVLYLLEARWRPVHAYELADKVFPEPVNRNTAEVYVKYIRNKLGKDFIVSRRGFGYVLKDAA